MVPLRNMNDYFQAYLPLYSLFLARTVIYLFYFLYTVRERETSKDKYGGQQPRLSSRTLNSTYVAHHIHGPARSNLCHHHQMPNAN